MKMCQVVTTNSHFPLVLQWLLAVITPIFPMNHGPLFLHTVAQFSIGCCLRPFFVAPGCLMVTKSRST